MPQQTTDSGPAFTAWDLIYGTRSGMSLRDYFAAHLAQGATLGASTHNDALFATRIYEVADAMIRARSAQSPAEKQAEHLREFGK